MMKKPLAVVVAAVVDNNNILLFKRAEKGTYPGLWSLPGGKIEENEHVSEAAIREVEEETGIKTEFRKYLGMVSEHLFESGKMKKHFLLHVCELHPITTDVKRNEEGEPKWFHLNEVANIKHKFVHSDYLMIEKMVKQHEKPYFNCVVEVVNGTYVLKKFS